MKLTENNANNNADIESERVQLENKGPFGDPV